MFQEYLNMVPPRNIRKVAESHDITHSGLLAKAHVWRWKERATAYDNHIQEARDRVAEKTAAQIERAHMRLLDKARRATEKSLDRIIEEMESDESERLKPKTTLAFLKEVITLERLAIGKATERSESAQGEIDLSELSLDELKQLRELQNKARGAS